MRPNFYFQKVLLPTTMLAILIVCLFSCNKSSQMDSKEIAEEHNEGKFDHSEKAKDAQFLVNAAEINLEEIELGQLSVRNASSIDVKELGKMMTDEHRKCFDGLKVLAEKKMITIPLTTSKDSKDDFEKLSEEDASKFDQKYCDMMVSGHKSAIAAFEKRIKETKDPEIKSWAEATLPDLRKHLGHASTCQRMCEELASIK